MPVIPLDIAVFMANLSREYQTVFMVEHTSPCAACNGGAPRMVHRDPTTSRLGGELRRLLESYPEIRTRE